MAVEDHRFALLAGHVDDFLFLGDRSHGLVSDLKIIESGSSGVKLTQTAIDQDQAGKPLGFPSGRTSLASFVTQPPVAAGGPPPRGGGRGPTPGGGRDRNV